MSENLTKAQFWTGISGLISVLLVVCGLMYHAYSGRMERQEKSLDALTNICMQAAIDRTAMKKDIEISRASIKWLSGRLHRGQHASDGDGK